MFRKNSRFGWISQSAGHRDRAEKSISRIADAGMLEFNCSIFFIVIFVYKRFEKNLFRVLFFFPVQLYSIETDLQYFQNFVGSVHREHVRVPIDF